MNVNPDTGQPLPPGSWFSRNWKWVLAVGCLVPLLCCGGSMAVAGWGFWTTVRDNAVYRDVVARLARSAQAAEALGAPVGVEGFPMANISARPGESHVTLTVTATGTRYQGQVKVTAVERDKLITYQRFELVTEKGEHIDLRDKSDLPDAPEQVDPSEPAPHEPPMPDNPEDE